MHNRAASLCVVVAALVLCCTFAVAHEDANGLRAVAALASQANASSSSSSAAASITATAAEEYGTILSGGVIASVTVALVFACFLLVLVLIEVVQNVSDFVEHRRMVAYRKSKGVDDPSEPKFGDFRDTAVNTQV